MLKTFVAFRISSTPSNFLYGNSISKFRSFSEISKNSGNDNYESIKETYQNNYSSEKKFGRSNSFTSKRYDRGSSDKKERKSFDGDLRSNGDWKNGKNSRDKNYNDRGSYNRYSKTPFKKNSNENYSSNDEWRTSNSKPRFGIDEKSEPIYGYYDGDHIFGINSVKMALISSKRNISELLIQTGLDPSNKKDEDGAKEILNICKEKNIPIREFSKHDLNMLSDNRPHQGFVLRASPLEFIEISTLEPSQEFKCVLVLDEVSDPQNFGALLRTSYFLGIDKVVTCAKNSSPLSTIVSKASSGAVEVMEVYSVNNLMKFLDNCKENGWQVVGTSLNKRSISLKELNLSKPTIVVLGNEGHGIRKNILLKCDETVKIDGNCGENSEVDSLNVSVSGGIVLHYILNNK